MNNKKTTTTRNGMVPSKLNKFSIRKYTVGTASILVGTTLIFGLSNHEAKAAESTSEEINKAKNEATGTNEKQVSEKVDSSQQNGNVQTKNSEQPKVTMSNDASVKETSGNTQSPQIATANQSTAQTNNKITTNDKAATTYSNESSKSNLTQAKDVSTTPKTTTIKPRTLNRMAVNTVAAPQTGTNVNDKVHFTNIDIAIDKGHVNKTTGNTEFWATSSDVLKLKANYTIDDSVKEGDTFTFKYGQYFRPGSVRLPSQTQNLYNAQGNIIAKGIYDSATNTTTYTFTNYVDQYTNVSGSIEQVSFAKRENATTDKTSYKMEVTLGNDKYSKDVIVDYGNQKAQPLISSTNYINNEDLSRNMTAYVNQPKNTYTKETFVTNLTGYKFNPNAKNFKIYEVTDQNQFVDSFTPDTSKLTDVTDKFKITYSNDNKTATVDLLNGQSSSDKQYIIQQVAYPDNSSTDNGKIDYTLETQNGKSSWSNSYSNVNGSSTANGDQKKYNLIENEIPVVNIPVGHVENPPNNIDFNNKVKGHIISVARLVENKQIKHQIEVIKRLVEKYPDIQLNIYGHGNGLAEYQQLVEKYQLVRHVKFHGFKTQVSEAIAKAQLMLSTSKMEGFGLAILESLSLGTPVISYDVDYGPAELIQDGFNGYLVSEGDIDKMVEKVDQLLNDSQKIEQFSLNSIQSAQQFNTTTVGMKWQNILS
ncbi:TPA: glycosyltransferase [Staphylococcus argenteus]|nr:glycosyltransferase [Staphylococcus argenteus]